MKFVVEDGTDEICIGGFGNDLGNKDLLKYTEEEIAKMIIENNNTNDNVRLANSLLRTIRNQENIIKEVREGIKEIIDYIYQHGFYYDSDEGAVPNELGMYEIAHITGELNSLIRKDSDKE